MRYWIGKRSNIGAIRRQWKIGVLTMLPLLAVGLWSLGCHETLAAQESESKTAGPPPALVSVTEVRSQAMAREIAVSGTVLSRHDARLAAEVAGRLEWVAEVGTVVATDEPLARLDTRFLELQLGQDEARIRRQEVNLTFLDRELERLQALTDQQITARNQLDELVSRRAMAEQELLEARLSRDQTAHRLERSTVVAPFPGQVVERLQQPGEFTQVGGPVVRLVDVGHTEVSARAPLDVAPHVEPGQEVELRDGAGRRLTTRVRTVIPVGDERSRMLEVRAELPTHDPWVVGTALRLALPASALRETVSVPRDALVLRAGATYLFKLEGDSTVERVDVETGVGSGDQIEVRGDIATGDRVVIRGGERLQPGQTVRLQG